MIHTNEMPLKSTNKRMTLERVKADFEEFDEGCRGVVLFGSYAEGEQTKRSDIDVCIIKPVEDVMDAIYDKLGGKYDIKVFENLPLYIKEEVIRNHEVVVGNELDLSEYFHFFRKLWQDVEHRIMENEFTTSAERKRYRRRWLHEKEKILREIGSI
jgi:predicted nucleotidyltransferase